MRGAERPPELRLPRPPRWPAWGVATSVALHGLAIVGLVLLFDPPPSGPDHFLAAWGERGAIAPRLVALLPPAAAGGQPATTGRHSAAPADAGSPGVAPAPPTGLTAADTSSAPSAGPPVPRHPAPSFQSGLLWDPRPPPPPAADLTHAERVDSSAKVAIRRLTDSLANLPNGGLLIPPEWKGTIGGMDFGLDSKWITLAGVKVPTFLLGLLPLPAGGNESKALDKTGQMRAEDYRMAIPRDAIADQQKAEIRKIREQAEAERELNRKQREGP